MDCKSICSLPPFFAESLVNTIFEVRDMFFEKGHRRGYFCGFNGKMKQDEMLGDVEGTSYDFGFRIYDARIARLLSRDPLEKQYSWYSTYIFAVNNPISLIDILGAGPGEPPSDDDTYEVSVSTGGNIATVIVQSSTLGMAFELTVNDIVRKNYAKEVATLVEQTTENSQNA